MNPQSVKDNAAVPVLPNNTDAERHVLGAILLEDSRVAQVAQMLAPLDFFDPRHQRIFQAMCNMAERKAAIDLLTLVESLTQAGKLESSGGTAYIAQLADGMPRVSNFEHYARIVKEKATLRNLAYQAEAIREAALARDAIPEEVLRLSGERIAMVTASANRSTEPADWRGVFHSWEDFENCPPLSFSIEGFLQNDGATMIGGLSGHGKTLILCSIVKALLAGPGAKLWDMFEVKQSAVRVVYLIPECSLAPFKHRLKLFRVYDCLAPQDDRFLVRTLSKGPTPRLTDPRILYAAKGAHVVLDTAARFGEGDENAADDNTRGLANDIFALLAAGARTVIAAHHSPKAFSKENVMRLENVLRGSGDIGAMLTTAWGVKQIDAATNTIHVENIKPRDFQPCGPFQIIGRPFIDEEGDFRIHKRPGECGQLMDEEQPERDKGGASRDAHEAKAAKLELLRKFMAENRTATSKQIAQRFDAAGVKVSEIWVRKNWGRVDE